MTETKPVSIISDNPEDQSIMFGFDAYARTIAELIANKNNQTPFVIGIYGSWGSGKTTLMEAIKRSLDNGEWAEEPWRRKTKTVWFQAWKYADEDAILAALIEEIFKTMKRDSFFEQCKAQVEKLAKTYRVSSVIGKISKLSGLDVTKFFADLKHKEKLGFFDTFQNFFDALVWDYLNWRPKKREDETSDDQKGALVIFIDDLDRCPSDRIVKVLETIKLFLDKPSCAFVVGAADEIIENALKDKYGEQEAARFMDKIVQVAFKLRPIPPEDIQAWVGKFDLENADEILPQIPLLAPALQKNPRQIKRFLNNVKLLSGIAAKKEISTSFASMLYVCIFEYVFPQFYEDIRDNPGIFATLKSHIGNLASHLERNDFQSLSDEDLKDVPQSLRGYLRDRALTRIVKEFSGTPEELAQLITLTGMVEAPETVAKEEDKKTDARFEEMAHVPAGEFLYGEEKESRTIEREFHIDIYPVTNDQYRKFIEAGGYKKDELWSLDGLQWRRKNNITEPGYWNDEKWNMDGHPVVGVSFYEAEAFANWAGKRLPTEIEWERAARGTDGRIYPWGDEFDKEKCSTRESGIEQTTRVTRYPNGASPAGCYDMAGNVWEWTTDWYDEDRKVLRGGSWNFNYVNARCASRSKNDPEKRFSGVGFRCVRITR